MAYDRLHCTCILWNIYSPLLIKLVWGYTSSIVRKINFRIAFLTPTFNSSCKNFDEVLSSKTCYNQRCKSKHRIVYQCQYNKIYIPPSIKTIHQQNLLIAFHTKPNSLWWVASNANFLNILQPFYSQDWYVGIHQLFHVKWYYWPNPDMEWIVY